jgi:hypothetical protein
LLFDLLVQIEPSPVVAELPLDVTERVSPLTRKQERRRERKREDGISA